MENYIYRKRNNSVKVSVLRKTAEVLMQYIPKGCPFSDYSLWDLLKNLVWENDWQIEYNKYINIVDFIRMLQADNNAYAVTYGNAIIKILEL